MPQLLRNVCDHCDLGLGTLARIAARPGAEGRRRIRELLAHRVKRIVVKPFMDLHTMLEERLQQCCVHVGSRARRHSRCLLRDTRLVLLYLGLIAVVAATATVRGW